MATNQGLVNVNNSNHGLLARPTGVRNAREVVLSPECFCIRVLGVNIGRIMFSQQTTITLTTTKSWTNIGHTTFNSMKLVFPVKVCDVAKDLITGAKVASKDTFPTHTWPLRWPMSLQLVWNIRMYVLNVQNTCEPFDDSFEYYFNYPVFFFWKTLSYIRSREKAGKLRLNSG